MHEGGGGEWTITVAVLRIGKYGGPREQRNDDAIPVVRETTNGRVS